MEKTKNIPVSISMPPELRQALMDCANSSRPRVTLSALCQDILIAWLERATAQEPVGEQAG